MKRGNRLTYNKGTHQWSCSRLRWSFGHPHFVPKQEENIQILNGVLSPNFLKPASNMKHIHTLYTSICILTSCWLTLSKPLSTAIPASPPDIIEGPGGEIVCTDSYEWKQPLFQGTHGVDVSTCNNAIADFKAAEAYHLNTPFTFQTTVTDSNNQQAVNRFYGDGMPTFRNHSLGGMC